MRAIPCTLRRLLRAAVIALVLGVSLILLAGCALGSGKSEFAGPDWSRGEYLGKAGLSQRPGLLWEPQSKSVLLVWLATVGDRWCLQFLRLDDRGQFVALHMLPLSLERPAQPKLWRDSEGGVHLFWLNAEESDRVGLYHVQLTVEGEFAGKVQRLSDRESNLNGYAVAEGLAGQIDLFWSDDARSGGAPGKAEIYHARLHAGSATLSIPRPLGIAGRHPSCVADAHGTLHLAWHTPETLAAERIYYAVFHPQEIGIGEPVMQAAFPAGMGLSLYPPEIGLEEDRAYILWSQERRGGGGEGPGTATTYYQTFLTGTPISRTGGTLDLPALTRPDYAPAVSAPGWMPLNYRWLAYNDSALQEEALRHIYSSPQWQPGRFQGLWRYTAGNPPPTPSEYTYMPCVVPGERGELALVVANRMALPRREAKVQIAFVVLQEGRVKGYQVAGRSRTIALRPIAVADNRGALHMAWLEAAGFGVYDLYYASTAPAVREALNRLTPEDILTAFLGRAWDIATALAFFPMLIVWWFIPFAFLVIFQVFRPDCDLHMLKGRIALVVAVTLYLLSKLFLFPTLLWYAPFLDAVPPPWENLIFFGLPVAITALSLLAMQGYIRRSERKMILGGFALFAALDSVLSLLIYMPNVFGG